MFFFQMVHILLSIVIMHYIFLISFGTIKILSFKVIIQILILLRRLYIMITSTYCIIIIDISQIIDSTLNPNLHFPILK